MFSNNNTFKYFNSAVDLAFLNIAFFTAAHLAQSLELLFANNLMFVLLLILNITLVLSVNITDIYDRVKFQSLFHILSKIFNIVSVQILTAILFLFIIKEPLFLRNFILFYALFLSSSLLFKNILVKYLSTYFIKKGIEVKKVLIVGTGEAALNFYESIKNNSLLEVVGFAGRNDNNIQLNILGGINELDSILTKHRIDEVILALRNEDYQLLDSLVKICNIHAVRVNIIPDYLRFISSNFEINIFNNLPIITLRKEPLSEFHWRFIKRTFDILISSLIILFIFPWLIPAVAILQKLFSPGSVFYIQQRVGIKDKTFKCYKFRSMSETQENENMKDAVVNAERRITKFGSFIRKSNLDEMPQFINVFLGQMTVVGPRPNPVSFHKVYKEYVDEYKLRHLVKPGLTGWAQIHGMRGDSPDEDQNRLRIQKRFEYDLWYIDNWSLKLDLQIIFDTVWQIINGKAKGS